VIGGLLLPILSIHREYHDEHPSRTTITNLSIKVIDNILENKKLRSKSLIKHIYSVTLYTQKVLQSVTTPLFRGSLKGK
jgi:hypothetical protein